MNTLGNIAFVVVLTVCSFAITTAMLFIGETLARLVWRLI